MKTLQELKDNTDRRLEMKLAVLTGWIMLVDDIGTLPGGSGTLPVPRFCKGPGSLQEVMDKHILIGLPKCNPILRRYRDNLAKVVGCGWYQSGQLLAATCRERTIALILTLQKEEHDTD